MKFNPDIHRRRSIRLKGYDYSSEGRYFVTICAQDRAMLFGKVVGAGLVSALMIPNEAGKMINSVLQETLLSFQTIIAEKYIIMPNHFHCILNITRIGAETSPAPTIGDFICAFKSKTTIKYIAGVNAGLYPAFNKRIWQRNYHERIIRNDEEYQTIWHYIDGNPVIWEKDCFFLN